MKNFVAVLLCFCLCLVVSLSGCSRQGEEYSAVAELSEHSLQEVIMNNYRFQKKEEFDVSDFAGTGKILNVYELQQESEADALCRGALLALFGEPNQSSIDGENAYSYMITVTDTDGNSCILTAYQGPSGPAVGGKSGNAFVQEAAGELAALIRSTAPADFEATVYYSDYDSKLTYGCKDGVPYHTEEQPVTAPWLSRGE